MYRLDNKILTAEIDSKGAELTSIQLDGLERMWEGDPNIWGRHAPLLFPLIGRLRDQQYELDGTIIHAPMHGFCRDRIFDVIEQTDTCIRFHTQHDEGTLAVYPFAFSLDVEFSLNGNSFTKRHIITNLSDRKMPFELGGHDAYRTTLMPDETMDDYAIAFEDVDSLNLYPMDESGALCLPLHPLPLSPGHLLEQLPADVGLDTFVMDSPAIRRVSLISKKSARRVTVEFDDFDYLGIWTAQVGVVTNYICIEPWSTLPDGHFVGRSLFDKSGIQILQPGETKTLSFTVTFD